MNCSFKLQFCPKILLKSKNNPKKKFQHSVKNELSRIRQAMLRDKQVHDHKTIRPVIDKAAASRFIRHELWVPKEKTVSKKQGGSSGSFNRKRKFNEDEDEVITLN